MSSRSEAIVAVSKLKPKPNQWALWAWAALILVAAWVVFRADYRADISAFLPKNPTPNQQLLVDQLKDGVVSRLTLIAIDGADALVLASLSKHFLLKRHAGKRA